MAVCTEEPLLIIGGGLIGLAVAHELARTGRKVEILSRSRNEAAGFVAAGMLAPHAEGLTHNLLRLGQLSLETQTQWVQKIEADSGLTCGLKKCGIIVPFLNAQDRDNYCTSNFGEKLNRHALEHEIPGITAQWQSALLFKQDGQIDNRRLLMRALEKACVKLGVHFQEGVEVLELIADCKTFVGIKIKNANGEIQKIPAKEAVLCCGAWSKQLLEELPIFPVKGQMLSIQGPKQTLKRVLFGPGTYLVPREDGLIIVGATSEKEAGFKKGLTPKGQCILKEGISSLLPHINKLPHMERWWGFRPCTPDEAPLLGKSSLNGLWLATGHHRNGVLLAAITAEIIAKSIGSIPLSKEESQLLKAFKWNRFNN